MEKLSVLACSVWLLACVPPATPSSAPNTGPAESGGSESAPDPSPHYTPEDFGLGRLPTDANGEAIELSDANPSTLTEAPWFSELLTDAHVLLIGEGHWSSESDRVGLAIVLAAAARGHRTVSLELPYSWGREMDRYIRLSDAEAKERRSARRSPIFEKTELLEGIRAYNRHHPDTPLSLRTHDIEHDWVTAARDVVLPYLRDRGAPTLEPEGDATEWAEATRTQLAAVRPSARSERREHRYIEAVVANIRSKGLASSADPAVFHHYRQKAIIANLVDRDREGALSLGDKAVVWGGSQHMRKSLRLPDGGAFLVEGTFLQSEYDATRGRVASVRLETLGYRFDGVADLDLNPCPWTGRRQLIVQFQEALAAGAVEREEAVAVDDLGPFEEAALAALDAKAWNTAAVAAADWAAMPASPALAAARERLEAYDRTIYVARSAITTPACARPSP